MGDFTRTLIAAGFGGQGVLMLGQLVAHAAMRDGHNVAWIPSYGPEMRGGTANCCIIVSDEESGSPLVSIADILVAMNKPSVLKFEPKLKSNGLLLYDEDLASYEGTRSDVTVVPVPASDIARELGDARIANIVMLGVLAELSDIATVESCEAVVREVLGKKKAALAELNLRAFARGRELAKEVYVR
ncbi:MAG TPA: 2-oxoacid:acceptor oxidoreductase family protein [Thermosynergistes sp.]|nr:2-oxoacid:acceptor oxidoreductase family protein [Thermosynergistes sp.]